jgi:hypothetical protein
MVSICAQCGGQFRAKRTHILSGKTKCCSGICRDFYKRRGSVVNCHTCATPVYRTLSEQNRSKTKTFFCTVSCREKWQDKHMPRAEANPCWKGGHASYRDRALRRYGGSCSHNECPLQGIQIPVEMLDVDHINNDSKDHRIENLRVLCVWCHAYKTRMVVPRRIELR